MRGDSLTPEGDAAYWSMRYTIRCGVTDEFDVPVFLESSSEAILVTGGACAGLCCCGLGKTHCSSFVLGWHLCPRQVPMQSRFCCCTRSKGFNQLRY